ncbi:ATP-binding cassette domain-containing protein [Diaphorobacter sp. HDW4A]|uniref:ATP-binding cassette domain-containing protein n=1 Tax=Diaphorobacter sp. HDW4A TaxID=2714924 RepID=UPI00140E80A9|nr:ATP-binding cassette domain-containing protein [Diaphorobacter sp. HDW4A]QIL81298.1 ATP-binding cassette domain-containing protein [Diaphorobacter sp. HDW4A]
MTADLQVRDLRFGYKGPLFEHFHAAIDIPGVYGLFGRNGTGKSTLLKLLAGLLTPEDGEIRVLGFTPRQRFAEFLAQVYLLPEEFHLPDLKPEALVRNHGVFYPQFNTALFRDYLAELQVPPEQRFSQMSLGQKKKATIAFALATCTPILLMDEPTNGLDIESRMQFKRLMQRPEHAGRIVLISTHQAHDLESIIRHIWFIDSGALRLSSDMPRLAEHLAMGVAACAAELPDQEALLYSEPLGAQVAWVARRDVLPAGTPVTPVQLELIYKALSLNPQRVLAAVKEQAP